MYIHIYIYIYYLYTIYIYIYIRANETAEEKLDQEITETGSKEWKVQEECTLYYGEKAATK